MADPFRQRPGLAAINRYLAGTARPIHLGRAIQVWEIRLEDDQGKLTCISRMTAAVIGR